MTILVIQATHESCILKDKNGVGGTDTWGVGFDAVGLSAGVGGGGFYSNVDTIEDLKGVDMCATVSVGGGVSGYASVCVGDGWAFSVSAGGGYEIGAHFNMSGAAWSMNITEMKRLLRCKRDKEKAREKVANRPYVDTVTPPDGQSAGTPGGASPGRPDIMVPRQ